MVSFPTEAEASLLSSLRRSSADSSEIPDLPEFLSIIMGVCQQKWVMDFLFSTEMSPLTALTAPVNVKNASSSSFSCTSIECETSLVPGSPTNHVFDIKVTGDIVFVPSFAVGAITVGFGIQRNSTLSRAQWGVPYHLLNNMIQRKHDHFRYARCDNTNLLLTVNEHAETDIIRIDSGKIEGTTGRKRYLVVLRRSKFHNMIRDLEERYQNIDIVSVARSCLLLTNYSHHTCACLQCGKRVGCFCAFTSKLPKHPLDFSVTHDNMVQHLGTYHGISEVNFFDNGTLGFSKKMGTRIKVEPAWEDDLVSSLSRWAISDKLEEMRMDPRQNIVPGNLLLGSLDTVEDESEVTKSNSTRFSGDSYENRPHKPVNSNAGHPIEPPQPQEQHYQQGPYRDHQSQAHQHQPPQFLQTQQDEQLFMLPEHQQQQVSGAQPVRPHGGFHEHVEVAVDPVENLQTQSSSGDAEISELLELEMLMNGAPNMTTTSNADGHVNANADDNDDMGEKIDSMFGTDIVAAISEDEDDMMLTQQIANEAQDAYRSENATWQGEGGSNGSKRPRPLSADHSLPRAAMTGLPIEEARSSVESGNAAEVNMDRERRAELRRQRNREAAQRSNLRRKLKNDTLKRDLKNAHDMASTLRAKELVLREENIKLRRQLSMM